MAAMSTKADSLNPAPEGPDAPQTPKVEEIPPSVIFEDASVAPLPIRDPKSASLIFRPTGQGCFP
jgi:hypothetical protein